MNSKYSIRGAFLLIVAMSVTVSLAGCSSYAAQPAPDRANILFVIVDDLNTDLSAYGHPVVETPSIDRLAADGLVFDSAYAQFTVCSPSRTSFLTGLYPVQTGVVSNDVHFRGFIPRAQTLPELFRANGYFVARVGKVFHYNVPGHIGTDGHDDPQSWMERRNPRGIDVEYGSEAYSINPSTPLGATLSWLATDDDGSEHTDALVTDEAVDLIRRHHPERTGQPFFLAVGFYRPHVPFIAPESYFQQYPTNKLKYPADYLLDRADIPIAALPDRPGQLAMSDDEKLAAIQGYYASISYVDAQIGRLIDALGSEGLDESTVVILISDHGFLLGQHGLWQKGDLFEGSTRVPMIVSVPEQFSTSFARGQRTDSIAELVDLYPTIAELAGLSAPGYIAGESLVPVLDDPDTIVRDHAYSFGVSGAGRDRPEWKYREVFGHTVRTSRYRYTEWGGGELGIELYDYSEDPNEQVNVVNHRDHLAARARLARILAQRRAAAEILDDDAREALVGDYQFDVP